MRSWYSRSVKSYASIALQLMTGRSFDTATFAAARPRYSNGRSQLWYWNQRLERAVQEMYAESKVGADFAPIRRDVWSKHRKALRSESAEVEAKACLLASEQLGTCEGLRVTPERLLDLLERRNAWNDVYWNHDAKLGDTPYNT